MNFFLWERNGVSQRVQDLVLLLSRRVKSWVRDNKQNWQRMLEAIKFIVKEENSSRDRSVFFMGGL